MSGGIFGPNGAVLTEAGLNNGTVATPGINITIHLLSNVYTKFDVQRAISPDGIIVEHDEHRSASRFDVPNAGALWIDEVGYKVAASPGVMSTWIRADGIYNTCDFMEYDIPFGMIGTRGEGDYAGAFLFDWQIVKLSGKSEAAALGVYVGGSAFYTPQVTTPSARHLKHEFMDSGLFRAGCAIWSVLSVTTRFPAATRPCCARGWTERARRLELVHAELQRTCH